MITANFPTKLALLVAGMIAASLAQDIQPIELRSRLKLDLGFVILPDASQGEARVKKNTFFRSETGLKFTKNQQEIRLIPDINTERGYVALKQEESPVRPGEGEYTGMQCSNKETDWCYYNNGKICKLFVPGKTYEFACFETYTVMSPTNEEIAWDP